MMPLTTTCFLALAALAAPVESVSVEVDASSIKPEGPGIARQLGDKVEVALAAQGISVDEASTHHLRVEVRQTGFISYDVLFVVEVDGVILRPPLENVTCEKCPLAKMDAAVVAKLPEAVALMEQATKPEPEPLAAEPEPIEPEPSTDEATDVAPPSDEPTKPRDRSKFIGPAGITGIVVGAGGLALVAAGIVKIAEPPAVEQDARAPEFDVHHDPERTGRALLGAGVATAIVGGVLIALDLTVLRRKRQELARMPWVVPGLGSLVIEGRF